MASNYDNELLLAAHEADQGCFEHLRCFCTIRPQFEALRVRLGPNFEAFWNYFCKVCTVPPTVPAPQQPPPVQNNPPLVPGDDVSDVTLTPRACGVPDPGRY